MSQESLDIDSYKQATILSNRLAKTAHVRAWMEEEGKRLVDEIALKQFQQYQNNYPSLSIDDYEWLKQGSLQEWSRLTERSLYLFTNQEKTIVVVRKEGRGDPVPPEGTMVILTAIRYVELLPFEMAHLWGGGYESLVKNSLI